MSTEAENLAPTRRRGDRGASGPGLALAQSGEDDDTGYDDYAASRRPAARRDYRPARAGSDDPIAGFSQDLRLGRLTADEMLSRYCTIVYNQTGSYEETARRVQLDRRTVKSKIDPQFAAGLPPR